MKKYDFPAAGSSDNLPYNSSRQKASDFLYTPGYNQRRSSQIDLSGKKV